MKSLSYLIIAATVLAMPAMAQERSAVGAIENQATWTALSSQVTSVNNRIDDANKRMDLFILCSKKGMLYMPGQPGTDADGCKSTFTTPVLGSCYQRGGPYGVHVTCRAGEVVTRLCTSGSDADCIAPGGTIMDSGQSALDGWRTGTTRATSQGTYTVLTCCKVQADAADTSPPPVVPVAPPVVTHPPTYGGGGGGHG